MIPPVLRENANFRRYFFGQAVSLLGDQVALIALPLTAVLALNATAAEMGALSALAASGGTLRRRARPRSAAGVTGAAGADLVATLMVGLP